MGYVELFARETSEASALVCDNDPQLMSGVSYGYPISASEPTEITVVAGIYRVWLQGRNAATTVYLRVAIDGDPAAEPDEEGTNSIAFSGDMTVRIRVPPRTVEDGEWTGQTVSALLSTGASNAKLFLVPLLAWIDD